jgi:hypothetical protein
MRKMTFLVGAGVGYVLGTRGGRDHYAKIQELARNTAERPEFRQAVDKVGPLAEKAKAMASQKIPGTRVDEPQGHQPDSGPSDAAEVPEAATEPTSAAPATEPSDAGSHLPPRGTFSPTYGSF